MYYLIVFKWSEFYTSHGLDALIYLKFLGALCKMSLCWMFFAILVTFPSYITGSRKYLNPSDPLYVQGTGIISLSNINPMTTDSYRYWATFFSVIFNSIVCYYFLFGVFQSFHKYRIKLKREVSAHTLGVRISNVPADLTDENIYHKLNAIFPQKILSIKRVPEISTLSDLHKEKKSLLRERARIKAMYADKSFLGHCMLFLCFRMKKGSVYNEIDRYNHKIIEINERIKSAQSNVNLLTPTPVVYVVFKDTLSARVCAQCVLDEDPFIFKTAHAPVPSDIVWENHPLTNGRRKIQFYFVSVIVFFLIVFWAVPVGFAASMANLKVFSAIFGFDTSEFRTGTVNWIEGILPSFVIWVFYINLIPLLRFLTRQQGFLTHSQIDDYTLTKFFAFAIVNIFLTSLLTGTAFDVWEQLVNFATNPPELLPLVASAIPSQSNFFIGYILINSIFAYSLQLLRPWWIGQWILSSCCHAYSPEDIEESNRESEQFDYPYYYGMHLLFLMIILTYSSIAPLILPFGILYFTFAYVVHIHNMTYVSKQTYEGLGHVWTTVFTLACIALGIYQVITTTLLSMNHFYWSFLLAPTVFVTYGYWHHLNKNMSVLCHSGPLDLKNDLSDVSVEEFKAAYVPTCLQPPEEDGSLLVHPSEDLEVGDLIQLKENEILI
uniref:CSC1/OSCA1-like 7TM region domain-containing protein n=1 Tax=Arcella intermedia TaxID=1963864 RepID=A0A6B2KZA0_9EUKA